MDAQQSTTPLATTGPAPVPTAGRPGTTPRRAAVVGSGVGAALVAWAVVAPARGVHLDARSGGAVQHVGAGAVILASLAAGLLAWGAVVVIVRLRPDRARTLWTVLGAVVLLLSLAGPAGGLTTADVVGLGVLHLVVGVVLVLGLRSTLPVPVRTTVAW